MNEARNAHSSKNGIFRRIASRTLTSYVRMAATVVIAVVVRICLDSIGIILTRQEPTAVSFWFAHCTGESEGSCVATGISIFVASLLGCCAFAWSVQDWLTDPSRNPRARCHSFNIVLEAATWVPISVVVGKTNALVEWFMDVSENDLIQAFVASAIAAAITLTCTLLTHVAMKYCRSVAENAQRAKAGVAGFFQFSLLVTLYCLGWAVGWSNWKLVLSMMDALEPGTSVHNTVLAGAVISVFLVAAICFYLRFGPEPIIPDPELQQLCYAHGYSGSIRRSLISYAVNSCTVFVVLGCSDSTYGFLHVVTEKIYSYSLSGKTDTSAAFHEKLLVVLVLTFIACVVTVLAVLSSAAITKTTEVDQSSSMRMSRSVSDARKLMLSSRKTRFGDDPRIAGDGELELAEAVTPAMVCKEPDPRDFAASSRGGGGDDAAGCPRSSCSSDTGCSTDADTDFFRQRSVSEPMCEYAPLDVDDLASGTSTCSSANVHSQHISRTVCASVLAYDVLGLVVCTQWGTLAFRLYGIIFGPIAGIHSVLYFISCLLYAAATIYSLTRFVWRFFPSQEELKWHRGRAGGDQSWWMMAEAKEPFLEDDEDALEDAMFFDRAPPAWPAGVSWPPLQVAPPMFPAAPTLQFQPPVPATDCGDASPQGAI